MVGTHRPIVTHGWLEYLPNNKAEWLGKAYVLLEDDASHQLMAVAAQVALANVVAGLESGITIFVKDNIEVVGLPATAGSLALTGRPVKSDAKLVSSLKSAGAIILGSTNLSEWANIRSNKSTSGWSAVGGLTANPWSYKHSAGGSSSGSGAAVAAGLIPAAIGTETDGSIVCPAALNGVVGIKPTVGRISTAGVIPISFSQDSPGPLARNVTDASKVLGVLLGESNFLKKFKPLFRNKYFVAFTATS
ncbi:MAG: hypothetical protein RJB15_1120 [Pseudomonadota bacterium]